MKSKRNRIENSLFVKSFKKINKNVVHIMMHDLLNLVFVIAGFFVWMKFLNVKAAQLATIDLENIMSASAAEVSVNIALIRGFIISLSLTTVLFLIYFAVVWSFFNGNIWSIILRKRFTLKYYKKFLLLNLAWVFAWAVFSVVFLMSMNRTAAVYFFIIIFFIIIHLTNILYVSFTEEPKLKSVKKAFELGFKNIHRFIVPYVLIWIVGIVLSFVFLIFRPLPDKLESGITLVLTLPYLAWLRIYIASCVDKVKKRGKK